MQMASLYDSVTRDIIKDLEQGVPIWVQPWKTKKRSGASGN